MINYKKGGRRKMRGGEEEGGRMWFEMVDVSERDRE